MLDFFFSFGLVRGGGGGGRRGGGDHWEPERRNGEVRFINVILLF